MLVETNLATERNQFEDPLSYLPRTAILEFNKGRVIYDVDQPTRRLYLVVDGCVKVSRSSNGSEIIMNICRNDDFFGEGAFVQASGERAVALERTRVMSWAAEALNEFIVRHPRLGIALVQSLTNRYLALGDRISTLAVDFTSLRLAKTLVQLAERLGHADETTPSLRRLAPLSHKVLAQYIGTTREAVTRRMNQFRRDGLVDYSRRDIIVNTAAMRTWMEQQNGKPEAEEDREADVRASRQPHASLPLDTVSA